jgi:hypothetical protein
MAIELPDGTNAYLRTDEVRDVIGIHRSTTKGVHLSDMCDIRPIPN